MLSYEFVIWALFRSIDLIILSVLAAWLFMRKLAPLFRREMADEQAQEQAQMQATLDLKAEGERLDAQLVADMHDIERLEQKIRLWQQSLKRKYQREATEKEDILVRLYKQNEQRAAYIAQDKETRAALLQAIERAEPVLMHRAEHDDAVSQSFIADVVEFVRKQGEHHV